MKRTTSLILCLVLSISLFAQSRGVTFQVHNETLTSVSLPFSHTSVAPQL
jgi:hypothetical protein